MGSVEGGAGAVEGGGDEVAVDLVGDLDALVAEPAGDLGDRDTLGQRGGGVEVAQRVRDELRRQPRPRSSPLEVLLVAAATTSLYFRPRNRWPSLVVPCSATCLSIASLTYSGSGMSRSSPALRNFSGHEERRCWRFYLP
jgi:hypothetical protein